MCACSLRIVSPHKSLEFLLELVILSNTLTVRKGEILVYIPKVWLRGYPGLLILILVVIFRPNQTRAHNLVDIIAPLYEACLKHARIIVGAWVVPVVFFFDSRQPISIDFFYFVAIDDTGAADGIDVALVGPAHLAWLRTVLIGAQLLLVLAGNELDSLQNAVLDRADIAIAGSGLSMIFQHLIRFHDLLVILFWLHLADLY